MILNFQKQSSRIPVSWQGLALVGNELLSIYTRVDDLASTLHVKRYFYSIAVRENNTNG